MRVQHVADRKGVTVGVFKTGRSPLVCTTVRPCSDSSYYFEEMLRLCRAVSDDARPYLMSAVPDAFERDNLDSLRVL